MLLLVHIKSKVVAISCGDGLQPVRWLANVGMARYDDAQGRSLGTPVAVKLENGALLGLGQSLVEAGLVDMQHVWVVFKAPPRHSVKGGAAAAAAVEDDAF